MAGTNLFDGSNLNSFANGFNLEAPSILFNFIKPFFSSGNGFEVSVEVETDVEI